MQVKNVIGREQTASNDQEDFIAAQDDRFDLTFTGRDGHPAWPVVLHRAPLGMRRYRTKRQETMQVDAFITMVQEEIRSRSWVKPDGD